MTRVAHLFALRAADPLDAEINFGRYKGRTWNAVCHDDPDWILRIVTESRVLLDAKINQALMIRLRGLTFE